MQTEETFILFSFFFRVLRDGLSNKDPVMSNPQRVVVHETNGY